eukprot:6878579-Alexandrium_andersonii.AAC.1
MDGAYGDRRPESLEPDRGLPPGVAQARVREDQAERKPQLWGRVALERQAVDAVATAGPDAVGRNGTPHSDKGRHWQTVRKAGSTQSP